MLAKIPRGGRARRRRDPKAAVAIYDQLAADGSLGRMLQDLAACVPPSILVDTAPYDEIAQRLEPLTAVDRTVPPQRARSAGAVGLARQGRDRDAPWTDMILADAETPSGTRGQIEMLLGAVGRDKKS